MNLSHTLQSEYPEVAKEWHPIKNGDLTAASVTPMSNRKVWWQCDKGHEWEAVVASRARGTGCPYCAGRRVIPGETDLATVNPVLAAEWHPTKNGSLTPNQVMPKAAMKVWWQCPNGHEWEEKILNRANGRGCPFCSHHRPIIGETDLATISPELAREWHPIKNGSLTPQDVLPNSGQTVWWLCPNGHSYSNTPNNRMSGNGCPYCSGRKVLSGFNDLATLRPALAAEWNYAKNGDLLPDEVSVGMQKKVWWICKKGHEYEATINNRAKEDPTGCPYCSGRRALTGYNDLRTLRPELLDEWDFAKNVDIRPEDLTIGSNKQVWWICAKGHSYRKSPSARYKNGKMIGCPQCRETGTSFPEQALLFYLMRDIEVEVLNRQKVAGQEVDIWIPEWKVAIEYNGFYWHQQRPKKDIDKNKILYAEDLTLLYVLEPGLSELPCAYSVMLEDLSLESLNQAIASIENYLGITPKDAIDVAIHQVAILSTYKVVHEKNSFAAQYPELISYWHTNKNEPLTPFMFTPKSNKRVWWQCPEGHEWQAPFSQVSNGQLCPYCSGKRVWVGFNDLTTIRPDLAAQWHPEKNGELTAKDVTQGSNKKIWWQCEHGHEWQATVASRSQGSGCPYCSGKKAISGQTDLVTVNPRLAAQWHPLKNGTLTPNQVKSRSGKRVWWQCEYGHEWQATIASRAEGYGCPYCAGQRAIPGETDLETLRPDLAKEWHPTKNGDLRPVDVMPGSGKKVWWLCDNGHAYQMTVANRNQNKNCPFCSGRRAWPGFNDLATEMPNLAAQWHPVKNGELTPLDVRPGSGRKVWWICEYGHEWIATISSRAQGHGCPYCANNRKDR